MSLLLPRLCSVGDESWAWLAACTKKTDDQEEDQVSAVAMVTGDANDITKSTRPAREMKGKQIMYLGEGRKGVPGGRGW